MPNTTPNVGYCSLSLMTKFLIQPRYFPLARIPFVMESRKEKFLKFCKNCQKSNSVKFKNGIDRSGQTVKTQIRLLLKEQSDQGLHCLPCHLNHLAALLHCKIKLFHF